MRRLSTKRIVTFLIIAALILQISFIGYSMVDNIMTNSKQSIKDEVSTEISKDILNLIKTSDTKNYTKIIDNYKALLKQLNVHIVFKNEIERLVKDGYSLPDILVAYCFLDDNYGLMGELEKLVKEKNSGKAWAAIFTTYKKNNPDFKPRNFDEKQLESLQQAVKNNNDDIMIADRVSQKTKVTIEEIINSRASGDSWRLINAELGVLNGQESIAHVKITNTQLTKYSKQSKLPEEDVVQAFVLANKLGLTVDSVINSIKQGLSQETISANAYEQKYY